MGVHEVAVRRADLTRFIRHQIGKALDGAADPLGYDQARIVGRGQQHTIEEIF